MEPTPIDLDTWNRRDHFEHYRRAVACTFSLTAEVDVTAFVAAMASSPRSSYVSQVWALSTVVNRHDELRMCLLPDGSPAVWPVVHPAFTVFNAEAETFSAICVPHSEDFDAFHASAVDLIDRHRESTLLFPMGPPPANAFDVSSLPWTSFSGFNLNVRDGWDHLAPIVTLGRYRRSGERVHMPVAVQIHHAAADGFHVGRLLGELGALFLDPSWAA
ncbi:CatA-like O-acetyltransferase [Aeromicrobium alkaliterrae]|uniref:Chloramphenicol acetyltransferase n=1 Tax=Aeromicrobium alkaliterrae TaxID=302168 RepID=A0ABN2JYY5_9ACTN